MDDVAANRMDVIRTLTEQRERAELSGQSFAGYLLDMAILQLRLEQHNISDEELLQLCDLLSDGLANRRDPTASS